MKYYIYYLYALHICVKISKRWPFKDIVNNTGTIYSVIVMDCLINFGFFFSFENLTNHEVGWTQYSANDFTIFADFSVSKKRYLILLYHCIILSFYWWVSVLNQVHYIVKFWNPCRFQNFGLRLLRTFSSNRNITLKCQEIKSSK